MATQFAQRNLSGGIGKHRVTGVGNALPEQSSLGLLAGAVKKVSDQVLQNQFNEEVQKREMEVEQNFKSGETVQELRDKESWVNTIFGNSAGLDKAISLQAEASYYNGYSDIMGQMDKYAKASPEEFSKFISDTYTGYMTGDPEVDSQIRGYTKKSRDALMQAHARGHQKFVQEQTYRSTVDLVRAKQGAYRLALQDEQQFGDEESFNALWQEQVKDLSQFYHGVAMQGGSEAQVVAKQVLSQINEGDMTGYEAVKDNLALFSQDDAMRITNAKQAFDAQQTRKQEVVEQQIPVQQKAQVRSALDQGLKNPLADVSLIYSQIEESNKAGFISDSVAETYYRKANELSLKQDDWRQGLSRIDSGKPVNIPSEEVEDSLAYVFNLFDSSIADPNQLAVAKATVRNQFPTSAAYREKNSRALENLVVNEQPNPKAVAVVEELMQLNSVGGNKLQAMRQLGNDAVKAKFSRILAEVEDRLANSTGTSVNTTGAIRDALMEIDRMDKLSEITTQPPKSLVHVYKDDAEQYKKDEKVVREYFGAPEDSVAFGEQLTRLRDAMDLFAKRNPNLSIDTVRDVVSANLAEKTFDKIAGLNADAINNDPVLSIRGMFEDTHDQLEHYLTFRRETDKVDGYNSYDTMFSPNGNFVLFEKDDEGVRTGRFFAVSKRDIAATWETSETYMKQIRKDQSKARELAIAQGREVPPIDIEDIPHFIHRGSGYISGTEEELFGTGVSAMDIRNRVVKFFQENNYSTLVVEPLLEALGIEEE